MRQRPRNDHFSAERQREKQVYKLARRNRYYRYVQDKNNIDPALDREVYVKRLIKECRI